MLSKFLKQNNQPKKEDLFKEALSNCKTMEDFLNTCLEFILHKIYPNIQCNVGFYGIIIGILIWDIINRHEVNIFLLLVVISVIVYPSSKKNNTSLIINIIGGLGGCISAYIISK